VQGRQIHPCTTTRTEASPELPLDHLNHVPSTLPAYVHEDPEWRSPCPAAGRRDRLCWSQNVWASSNHSASTPATTQLPPHNCQPHCQHNTGTLPQGVTVHLTAGSSVHNLSSDHTASTPPPHPSHMHHVQIKHVGVLMTRLLMLTLSACVDPGVLTWCPAHSSEPSTSQWPTCNTRTST
jgi:hypothetical protein